MLEIILEAVAAIGIGGAGAAGGYWFSKRTPNLPVGAAETEPGRAQTRHEKHSFREHPETVKDGIGTFRCRGCREATYRKVADAS